MPLGRVYVPPPRTLIIQTPSPTSATTPNFANSDNGFRKIEIKIEKPLQNEIKIEKPLQNNIKIEKTLQSEIEIEKPLQSQITHDTIDNENVPMIETPSIVPTPPAPPGPPPPPPPPPPYIKPVTTFKSKHKKIVAININ